MGEMTVELAKGEGVTVLDPDELVKLSLKSLKAGAREVRPGQANVLAVMRRLAPDFISRQLWKAGKKLVPSGVDAPALSPART